MSKDKKTTTTPPQAIRWIPTSAGVYDRQNIASPARPLILTEGAIVGIGEPLGEGSQAVSEEFAADLVAAGHAEYFTPESTPAPSTSTSAPSTSSTPKE